MAHNKVIALFSDLPYASIPYDTEEELNKTIYDILDEMEHTADLKHCFTEADICTLGGEQSW